MADNSIRKALKPLEDGFGTIFGLGGQRDMTIKPTEVKGAPGTALYGGYVQEIEKDASLTGRERYRTFSQILADTSIVSAGVRYFLNLAAGATWSFEAAEDHPMGEELAEAAEKMLTEDPETSWARVVRRAAMYRFYGFSVQEWVMKRAEDGSLTFQDIAPRPQITITRWDVDVGGGVLGMIQTSPQTQKEIYLPRGKVMYLVDDTLNDSPEGLGLFRHIVGPQRRLKRYEQLEGFGFEGDLRGIPVGRAPYTEINQRLEAGEITAQQAAAAVAPIETFIRKHIKNPELGLLLDSDVYATLDESARPSGQAKFSMELLDGSQNSLPEAGKAIERLNFEIARILGIEAMLLGGGSAGSWALAREKTSQFSLTIDATLDELADAARRDLLAPLWAANGWPEEAMPTIKVEAVQYRDIEQITRAIRDLAQSGAPISPDDPVVGEVRSIVGLKSEPVALGMDDEDASLMGGEGDEGDDALDDDEALPDIREGDDE